MKHATVMRDGFEVPLIGIPEEAVLETCDCCGDTMGLSKSVFSGHQILCHKCSQNWEPSDSSTAGKPCDPTHPILGTIHTA